MDLLLRYDQFDVEIGIKHYRNIQIKALIGKMMIAFHWALNTIHYQRTEVYVSNFMTGTSYWIYFS